MQLKLLQFSGVTHTKYLAWLLVYRELILKQFLAFGKRRCIVVLGEFFEARNPGVSGKQTQVMYQGDERKTL